MRVYFDKRFYSGLIKDAEIKKYIKASYDKQNAKVFMRRIRNARDASSLHVVLKDGFPGGWELLKGDKKGQISATLRGAKRLICTPNGELKKFYDKNGNLDTKLIDEIIVISIENYHR